MVLIRIAQKFTTYFTHKAPELGRWSLLECNDALQKRIDMANIDHCGPCGFDQIREEKNKKFTIKTGHSDNKELKQ